MFQERHLRSTFAVWLTSDLYWLNAIVLSLSHSKLGLKQILFETLGVCLCGGEFKFGSSSTERINENQNGGEQVCELCSLV